WSILILTLLLTSCSRNAEVSPPHVASKEQPPPALPEPPKKYTGSLITDRAPYEWRDGAKLHFFKGKYWLLGGWTVGPRKSWDGDQTTNEIWSSPDLATWALERKHVSQPAMKGPDARWSRRHC